MQATRAAEAPHHEYIVLGAGPAGLQVAYYLQAARQDYLVLEAGDSPGTFFKSFPRHRKLISINKVHTGYDDAEKSLRWDWNSLLSSNYAPLFTAYNKEYFPPASDLLRYLSDYAAEFRLHIRFNTAVTCITREKGAYRLITESGDEHRAHVLVVATGVRLPYVPEIEGIEHAERYVDVSVDPADFANQRVLLIGKGNSAFETADNLVSAASLLHLISPHPVRQAWKTHYPGSLRAVNNNILETYRLKGQNAVLDANLERLRRLPDGGFVASVSYAHAHGEKEELRYDRAISCTGFRGDFSMFDEGCRPELSIYDRFPALTSSWESTNVEGLFFAGTLMQARDYKKSATPFIHGFRYNVRALCRMLAMRTRGRPWPHRVIPATAEAIAAAIIDRVNRTSALWQQFGYLCDLVVVSDDRGEARYYEELPVDFVDDAEFGASEHYYKITLEYGHEDEGADPFANLRIERTDTDRAAESKFLHPIVRRFRSRELLREHHVIEDLAAEWAEPEHVLPLQEFLGRELSRADSRFAGHRA